MAQLTGQGELHTASSSGAATWVPCGVNAGLEGTHTLLLQVPISLLVLLQLTSALARNR